MDEMWLGWFVLEPDGLCVYSDGLADVGHDPVAVLVGLFGDFIGANCLTRCDVASLRVELRANDRVLAELDGRDWW